MESDPRYCGELADVMALNKLNYSLECVKASSEGLAAWIREQDHVDLLDMDVQGAEIDLLEDPTTFQAINSKVYRVVIGTHSPEIHQEIAARFQSWILIYDLPYAPNKQCLREHLRGARGDADQTGVDVGHFHRILELGCYNWSPWGRIPNWDGELIFDNPHYVTPQRHFTMSDRDLVADELDEPLDV